MEKRKINVKVELEFETYFEDDVSDIDTFLNILEEDLVTVEPFYETYIQKSLNLKEGSIKIEKI